MKTKKLPKLGALKKKAWTWFSLYIRTRDCINTTGYAQEGSCFTCHTIYPLNKLQAGHFIPGRGGAVLFEEDQVHAQCMPCNVWKHGDWPNYYENMVMLHGLDKVKEMMQKRHKTRKWLRFELEELAEKYKKKVENYKSWK